MNLKRFFLVFVTVLALLVVGTSDDAYAQDAADSTEQSVTISNGGWAALGGTITWASFTPVMFETIAIILTPDDPQICEITPAECENGFLEYSLVGLSVIGTIGLTVLGGWATGKAAEFFELDPKLGWGLSGGIVGIPTFGMLWLSVPSFEPGWLNTTLGTVVTAGGAFATGYYFAEIAERRGHAWPEFGFGLGGVVLGASVGSLFCGGETCAGTTLGGAFGGLLGVGLTTLLWGTEPSPQDMTTASALQQQPLVQYGFEF